MDFDESSGPSAAQAATDQPQRKRMRVKRERILYRGSGYREINGACGPIRGRRASFTWGGLQRSAV
jgi:hypothetical protein